MFLKGDLAITHYFWHQVKTFLFSVILIVNHVIYFKYLHYVGMSSFLIFMYSPSLLLIILLICYFPFIIFSYLDNLESIFFHLLFIVCLERCRVLFGGLFVSWIQNSVGFDVFCFFPLDILTTNYLRFLHFIVLLSHPYPFCCFEADPPWMKHW